MRGPSGLGASAAYQCHGGLTELVLSSQHIGTSVVYEERGSSPATKNSTIWEQIRYTYCRRSQGGRNAQKEGANIGSLPFSSLFSSLWFATPGGPLKEQYGMLYFGQEVRLTPKRN